MRDVQPMIRCSRWNQPRPQPKKKHFPLNTNRSVTKLILYAI